MKLTKGDLNNFKNVGASINTQPDNTIERFLIDPNEVKALNHANMAKSANFKNDELLTDGIINVEFEGDKKS